MADQPNVFEENTPPPPTPPTTDPFADKLMAIVGPDGKPKYANTELALAALVASQAHIATLESESAARRAEIERLREVEKNAKTMEQLAERLNNGTPETERQTPPSGLDANAIKELVKSALADESRQTQAQANIKRVNDALVEKFKDPAKAKEQLAAKAAELQTTVKELGDLAARNPNLVLQLFGQTTVAAPSPTQTSVHLQPNPQPQNTEVKLPELSLISGPGATDKNRQEVMAKIRENVWKRLDVTT